MASKKLFYGWYIVGACFFFSMIFAGSGFYSFSIFIKPIESEFGWSRSEISLTMSIYLVIGGIIGPVAGQMVQKFGPRKVMLFGAVSAGACFMAVSQTNSLWYFYTAYALLAVSVSCIGIIPISSLLSNWFEQKRGTAIGMSMVGIAFGGLILAPVVGAVTSRWGWHFAFLGIGLLVWAVAIPLIFFVLRNTPAELGLKPDGRGRISDLKPHAPDIPDEAEAALILDGWETRQALSSRTFWLIFVSFFLAPFAQMGVLQHQVPIIMGTGTSEAIAAAALGATAGIGGLGKLSFGRMTESIRFRYVILMCFGLQAMAVVILMNTASSFMVWLYALLFGFSMGGVVVLMPMVVGKYWGLKSYSVLLGIIWVANAAGGSSGTYVSGLIYDYLGSYHYALYLFIGSYILAIIIFFLAGSPKDAPVSKTKNYPEQMTSLP